MSNVNKLKMNILLLVVSFLLLPFISISAQPLLLKTRWYYNSSNCDGTSLSSATIWARSSSSGQCEERACEMISMNSWLKYTCEQVNDTRTMSSILSSGFVGRPHVLRTVQETNNCTGSVAYIDADAVGTCCAAYGARQTVKVTTNGTQQVISWTRHYEPTCPTSPNMYDFGTYIADPTLCQRGQMFSSPAKFEYVQAAGSGSGSGSGAAHGIPYTYTYGMLSFLFMGLMHMHLL